MDTIIRYYYVCTQVKPGRPRAHPLRMQGVMRASASAVRAGACYPACFRSVWLRAARLPGCRSLRCAWAGMIAKLPPNPDPHVYAHTPCAAAATQAASTSGIQAAAALPYFCLPCTLPNPFRTSLSSAACIGGRSAACSVCALRNRTCATGIQQPGGHGLNRQRWPTLSPSAVPNLPRCSDLCSTAGGSAASGSITLGLPCPTMRAGTMSRQSPAP